MERKQLNFLRIEEIRIHGIGCTDEGIDWEELRKEVSLLSGLSHSFLLNLF
jgi:hypothetical protein